MAIPIDACIPFRAVPVDPAALVPGDPADEIDMATTIRLIPVDEDGNVLP